MTKQLDERASPASKNETTRASAPLGSSASPAAVEAVVAKIQMLNADWRANFAEMQKKDVEFAFRVARCSTPADAMQVCGEWMNSRTDSVLGMQKRFLDLWLRTAAEGSDIAASPEEDFTTHLPTVTR